MCDDVLTEIRTANTRQLLDSGGHFAKYWGGGDFNIYALGVRLRYANLSNIMLGISKISRNLVSFVQKVPLSVEFENTVQTCNNVKCLITVM